jgi:hypothetical protein
MKGNGTVKNKQTGIMYRVVEEGLQLILQPIQRCHAVLTVTRHELKRFYDAA